MNPDIVGVDFKNIRANQFADTSSSNDKHLHDWIWIECVACVNQDK